MKAERRQTLIENLVYLILWLVILVSPMLELYYNEEVSIEWQNIWRAWRVMIPFMIIFLINNYLFIPRLLLRKRIIGYLVAITLLTGIAYLSVNALKPQFDDRPFVERKLDFQRQPGDSAYRAQPKAFREAIPPGSNTDRGLAPQGRMQRNDPRPPLSRRPFMFFHLFNFFTMATLIIGLNIAIKLLFKSIRDEHRLKELEKQKLSTELEYLKHQINPHFFMNTLNNIHALIDIDSEQAKQTVLELSKMMRYVLYDAALPRLPLQKEIQFLRNYIELMRIRYTDKVDIQVSFPEEVPDVSIPPLLCISFIENAFKHGISYRNPSFIYFCMKIEGSELHCQVINSSFGEADDHKGVGLDNIRKRLRLLYGEHYTLHIENEEESYKVLLIIPLES